MKVKTILIASGVSAALVAGGVFGAYQYARQSKKPVDVVPVSNIRMDMSWGMDENSISGQVISVDTQSVDLSTEYPLQKVYVKAGDTVKRGDPLLEYDMTMRQLEREMEDLSHQTLELELQTLQRNLDKLMKNPGASSIAAKLDQEEQQSRAASLIETEKENKTGSSDGEGIISDSEESNGGGTDTPGNAGGGNTGNAGENGADIQGGSVPEAGTQEQSAQGDDSLFDDEDPDELREEWEGQDLPVTSDLSDSLVEGEDGALDSSDNWPQVNDPDAAGSASSAIDVRSVDENLLEIARWFIQRENVIHTSYDTSHDYIQETLNIFREDLARAPSQEDGTLHTFTDIFGAQRTVGQYYLSQEVISNLDAKQENLIQAVGEEMAKDYAGYSEGNQLLLYKAYGNVCLYNLERRMETLKNSLAAYSVDDTTTDQQILQALEQQIRAAVDAYYLLRENLGSIRTALTGLEGAEGADQLIRLYQGYLDLYGGDGSDLTDTSKSLSRLVMNLKGVVQEPQTEALVEDPEPATEEITELNTEWNDPGLGDPGMDDLGDDSALSREELEQELRDARSDIEEKKLQIRESDLKLRQFDRVLDGRVITATMDGVVQTAGDTVSGGSNDGFIVISGKGGMYVEGSVNELSRETISIGDKLTGTSYDTGESFTAEVTEISQYPNSGNDSFYYGFSQENPNSSYYPFLAYIEDATNLDLSEGSVEMQFEEKQQETGIYIENSLIRTDVDGSSYVYIQGEDSLLKKQTVKTGKSLWGYYTEVRSGLSLEDKIAFPYGRDVTDGAKTREVESFYEDYGY